MRRHVRLARGKGTRFRGYAPDRAYQDWIRARPCAVASPPMHDWLMGDIPTPYSCWGRIEAAHVISRGAGGQDAGNLLPLCTTHHREQHAIGIRSFEAKHAVSLRATAERLWRDYQGEGAWA